MATPLNPREHAEEARLDRHPGHCHVSVLARVPGIIIFAKESCFCLLGDNGRQLGLVFGELGLRNDVPDPAHHEEAALDRRIKEVGDVVTVAQVAPVAIANALGGSDVCLVPSGVGGLGHRELVNTGDVPEAVVHIASLGIHEGVAEVIGRGQEDVPLGAAEELLVAREVPGVDLLAADKVKISDVVVDHVGGVGSGHDGVWCVFALVALGRGVVVLFGDYYGFGSGYMLILLPGTNDNCLSKRQFVIEL